MNCNKLYFNELGYHCQEGKRGARPCAPTFTVVQINENCCKLRASCVSAHQTKALIQQNISLAVVPNLAALGLATTVGMHPLVATVVHNGSAIAAGINGLRPLMHRD